MAYVLIFLGFLDREVSNVTVHAVAQAAVQMKESDDQNASFVLEIDVAERCARKTCYNIPRWLLEGFVDYFVSVRSEFLDHGEGKTQLGNPTSDLATLLTNIWSRYV